MKLGIQQNRFRGLVQAVAFAALFLLSVPALAAFYQHRDPRGFSLQVPQGWRVDAPGIDRIAVADPGYGAFAMVRARIARGDLADWLARGFLPAEGWGAFNRLGAEAVGPDTARAAFAVLDRNGERRRINALAIRRGDIATVFVAAAPEAHFARALPTLATILDSFRFDGGDPGSAATGAPRFTTVAWVDPIENAFSVQVPQGWAANGGIWRRGQFVKKPVFTITSPDGRATVFMGNRNIPSFMLPSQLLASLGWGEGSNGGVAGSIVARYREAADMGTELVQRFLGPARFTARRERPDAAETYRTRPSAGTPFATGADLEFQLADGRIGMMTIVTAGYEVPGLSGAWDVEELYGFSAVPDMAATTGLALARIIGTFRVNPVWFAAELGVGMEEARRLAAYREQSAAQQQQILEQRWASQDQQGREFRDVLGNAVRLVDPQTGETFETQAGSRYYYRPTSPIQDGTMAGADVDSNPNPIEMRRMLQFGVDLPYR